MSKPEPSKYKTTNWNAYHAALKSRGSLSVWFDKDMQLEVLANGEKRATR